MPKSARRQEQKAAKAARRHDNWERKKAAQAEADAAAVRQALARELTAARNTTRARGGIW